MACLTAQAADREMVVTVNWPTGETTTYAVPLEGKAMTAEECNAAILEGARKRGEDPDDDFIGFECVEAKPDEETERGE